MKSNSTTGSTEHIFDARAIAKRFRHSAIFGAMEAPDHGETMRFINDHDPLPLLAQMQRRYGDQIMIAYIERGSPVVIDLHVGLQRDAASECAGSCGGAGGCGCSGR